MKFIKRFIVLSFSLGCIGVIVGFVYMFNSIKAAEPLVDKIGEKIKEYNSKPSRIFSANGKLLYEVKPVFRDPVLLSSLPKRVKYAVLAAEDKRFYDHSGVDPMGLLRASRNVITHGKVDGGGSTITMQLAKKLFSASEKTMDRKVRDIAIAIEMEKRYTKDQILELYINQIYYGEQAYGLNAAAEIYFGKEAQDLDLAEAAMIARCIRVPSTQNPVKNYQVADANKIVVLDTMKQEGWITDEEYQKAKEEKPKVRGLSKQKFSKTYFAPYYVAAVKRDLDRMNINISEGGYTITTTLDTDIQAMAEKSVESVVRNSDEANVGAFICMDSEGRILADVGGRDFAKNQYSYTTQSMLQPGSSFKAFVYSEGLREGLINEESELSNEKIQIKQNRHGDYIPSDHHQAGGTVSLFTAYTQSWNLPAIHTYMNLGPPQAAKMIKEDFGFDSDIKGVPSAALGSSEVKAVEMLEAYSVFVLDGKRVSPYRIKEVDDPGGDIVYQGKMEYVNTRIRPEICTTMDRLNRGVVTSGTARNISDFPEARGKTGTTNEGKSVWFCGYAKGIVGIAWAGHQVYDKRRNKWLLKPMPSSYGADLAAPIWAGTMGSAIEKYGSDVKPDFSKHAEDPDMNRKHRRDDTPDANNAENIPVDISNNEPTDTPSAPTTPDPDPLKGGDGTEDPKKDPASDPGTTTGDLPPKIDTTPKTRDEGKQRHDKKEDEMVDVEVCADSGMLATRYCPETLSRHVAKSKRPKKRCTVHKAPDEGGGTR